MTLAQPFLFPVHSTDQMPPPLLELTFKNSCFFGRWRRQVLWHFSKRRNQTHCLSKRSPVQGVEGSCLFVAGVSCSGALSPAQEKLPGSCLLWMQLQGAAVCVPWALGEQAQISIYPRSFQNCIPDKFCENRAVPGGQGPSQQLRFAAARALPALLHECHMTRTAHRCPQPATPLLQAPSYFLFPIFLLG